MSASSNRHPKLAIAAIAVVATAVLGTLGAIQVSARDSTPSPTPAAIVVDVAAVLQKEIKESQTYSGRLAAVDKVDVRPLVSGTIVSVNLKDGQMVKKGDVLFIIDPRPYQAEVDRAAGQVAAARARVTYTTNDWSRAQRLITDNAIAKRDYDEKQNAANEAVANLKTAQAALKVAEISLGYTRVTAPISGRVSRAETTLGNVVSAGAGSTPLTRIVSVSPIYAEFDADEQTYLQYIRRVKGEGEVPVDLGLADEDGYSRTGVIQSVDNRVDTTSGTIRVRARFDNSDGSLVPGLYARVKVISGHAHSALLVNDGAIGTDQDKRYVYIVGKGNQIAYREIQVGSAHGNLRVVKSGIQPGERIVVGGTQRVRPGEKVNPHIVPMIDTEEDGGPSA